MNQRLLGDTYDNLSHAIDRLSTTLEITNDAGNDGILLDVARGQIQETLDELEPIKDDIERNSNVLEQKRAIMEKYAAVS